MALLQLPTFLKNIIHKSSSFFVKLTLDFAFLKSEMKFRNPFICDAMIDNAQLQLDLQCSPVQVSCSCCCCCCWASLKSSVDEVRLPIGGTVVVAASPDDSEELMKEDIRSAVHRYHTKNNRATASDPIGNAFSLSTRSKHNGHWQRIRLEKSMR